MMKMLSLVSRTALAVTLFSAVAYGDDAPAPQAPVVPQDVKLTPEMQAMLGELLKMLTPDQNGAPQAGATDAAKMAPMIGQLLKSLGSDQGGNQGGKVDPNKLAPMISQLMKMLDPDSADDSKPTPNHDSSSTSTPSNGQSANNQKSEQTPGLQTHALHSSGLTTSSLGGPRMTNDQWRDLFPVRH